MTQGLASPSPFSASLNADKTKVLVRCPYTEKDLVKAVGGGRWNAVTQGWEFPVRALPRILSILKVECSPEVATLAESIAQEIAAHEIKARMARYYLQGHLRKPRKYQHLYSHQYRALQAASVFDSYALFMETGTGKTLVAIELIKKRGVKTLVVSPLSTLQSVWMEELARWAPNLVVRNLWKDLAAHKPLDPKSADVFVVNFESFKRLHKVFLAEIGFLIVDESSKMKDPRAQITKALLAASKIIPKRLILSGTPAPNSALEYWAQVAFVNPDLLGESFYAFRNTYFYPYGYGGYQYACSQENREKIMERIRRQACFFSKEDCLDLPEKVFEKRGYAMEPFQRQFYDELFKTSLAEMQGKVVIGQSELAKLMKLRQVTSGFAIADDGSQVEVSQAKLKLLTELLDEIGPKQVLIWCQFHWEIHKIKEMLGERAATLFGEMAQSEKESAITDFKSGKAQYLIAHPKSGGHGLTFVNCSYNIYFSLSYSLEEEKQSQDRTHRIGQKTRVTYFYLLAQDSIDEIIFQALRKKQGMAEAMLEMLKARS